jgi:hypothetical protein
MNQNKWKWFSLVFMAVAVIFSFSGCHDSGDSSGFYHHNSLGTIELNNDSDATIDGFYLVPIDQTSWGSNILADLLYPGENTLIVDIDPGYYDARITVTGLYSDYFGYLYDIPIDAGLTHILNMDNSIFTGSLELHNNSSSANIIGVYVVSANTPTWGDNQTSSYIRPTGQIHLNDMDPGFYDVRVVWDVGPETIKYDIRVDSLALTTLYED